MEVRFEGGCVRRFCRPVVKMVCRVILCLPAVENLGKWM